MQYLTGPYYIKIDDDIFIDTQWLALKYGIPIKTMLNGISMQRKGKTRAWIAQKGVNNQFVCYSSILTNTVSRYQLPDMTEILKELTADKAYSEFNKEIEQQSFHRLIIACAITNYKKFLAFYHEYNLPLDEKIRLAKSHSVLDLLINFNQLTVREKYVLYNEVYDETFAFKGTDYAYFASKIREIEKVGIADALTKKYFGNTNAVKVTARVKNAIMHLYKFEAKLSTSQITKLVNAYLVSKDYPTVSQTTVFTTIKNDPKLQNILNFQRDGEKWVKDKIYPKLARIHAIYPGDLYEIDGTRLQIPYKGERNKPAFLVMVVLLDVCTRKVLAIEFADNETAEMYESVVRKAIKSHGFLPAEILTDNFSPLSNTNSGFAGLMSLMEQRGTVWRKHTPGNARDKGHIESFFKKFQHQYCRFLEGFVGEGVTSKNRDAHPSPEFLSRSLRSGNLRTREQLIDRVVGMIQSYNNEVSDTESFERDSPDFKFTDLNKPNVIPLSENELPRFIYPLKVKQVMNCSICIRINKMPYYL